ncbi:serine/threonine-protein kinase [Nocardiopsis ansamitocini]|uniref:serine/threonine-protein kinase n=1 Tax=Nocardiopsis ansamitocini TaxID=1670832 RepID=UPI002552771D|nr:serine/threonine-protein kinase [Nocardiopsis ansamitocini]
MSDPVEIGGYRILERIGVGGMGAVYAALTATGERVAVKVVHQEFATNPTYRARFVREVDLLARVGDSFSVHPIEADIGAYQPWLAMPYIAGPTLGEHIVGEGPMAGRELVEFTAGIAQALVAIHRAGVVHRDLKPDNVILSSSGPRILDFGIAQAMDEPQPEGEEVLGSPGWISPEQFHEHPPRAAADVFAWGGLVAYASTGRRPFGTGSVETVAMRALQGRADLRGMPHGLLPLVEAALAPDPARRPCSEKLLREVGRLAAAGHC